MKRLFLLLTIFQALYSSAQQWVKYEGTEGPGKGKHIVFVSGDEEYRSEEALPALAQILSKKYGFTCTVLFSIDPATGRINALNQNNIPGLEHLRTADLLVIFTRFRELPDMQMKYIDEYVKAGKPIIGIRTATHAFAYKKTTKSIYAKYSFDSKVKGWEGGFGKIIFGETWVSHHGIHGKEGTRALINGIEKNAKNPLLNGVADIWVPTDVYTIRKIGENFTTLIYGQSTNGMIASAPVNLEKPVLPVAWTKTYIVPNGRKGKVFVTTMGSAIDLLSEDLRRLLINACFWGAGLEKLIPEKADVDFISEYHPTTFGFDSFKKSVLPSEYQIK